MKMTIYEMKVEPVLDESTQKFIAKLEQVQREDLCEEYRWNRLAGTLYILRTPRGGKGFDKIEALDIDRNSGHRRWEMLTYKGKDKTIGFQQLRDAIKYKRVFFSPFRKITSKEEVIKHLKKDIEYSDIELYDYMRKTTNVIEQMIALKCDFEEINTIINFKCQLYKNHSKVFKNLEIF